MKPQHLDFYFDYLSPYAYFAWRQIVPLCDRYQVELRIHPVVFGKLLDHWGQLGPAEIPPKREFVYKYCYRYARLHGFAFNPPKYHPFNPVHALRLSLKEVCGDRQRQVVSAIFNAGWSQGQDIGNPTELAAIVDALGLDGAALWEKATTRETKETLKQETREGIKQGVFGVPTVIVGGQLFWGNDQLEYITLCLEGADPLDAEQVTATLARPRAIDRKAIAK
jgi:2-hydroxychromene-2-carboxylate isomerase